MKSHLGHILFNVKPTNLAFYRDLLTFLGWRLLHEEAGMMGIGGEHGLSLWFMTEVKDVVNDYDGPGVNHLALSVASQNAVDTTASYLTERGVELLFETPRHRPEFAVDASQTYYQIMFASPDRILLEVVYIGARDA